MRQGAHFIPNPKATLREQMHEVMRFFHYSTRTEDSYWQWVVRFLRFHKKSGVEGPEAWRHPREMGAGEVKEFLSWLATEQQVAAATQNQALNALVFFCHQEALNRNNEVEPRMNPARPLAATSSRNLQVARGRAGSRRSWARVAFVRFRGRSYGDAA